MKHFFVFLLFLSALSGLSQNITAPGKAADSLLTVGTNLFRQGKFEQSAQVLTAAQTFALQAPGRESALYAGIAHYLGTDYLQLGKQQEAFLFLVEALEIRRRVLGPDDPECGKTLNNLAFASKDLGKLNEAEDFAIRALLLKEKNQGKETLDYGNSQNALTQVLQAKGTYARADSVALDLLERRKKLAGERSVPYANTLNLRAGILTWQYRLEEAEQNYLRALDLMKSIKGVNSIEYFSVFSNMGHLYAKLGQYDKAETAQRECLKLSADLKGKDSKEHAAAVNNLGFILQQQGRFWEALPILEEARQRNEKIFGTDHPETLRVIGNQATAYYYEEAYVKAAPLFEQIALAFEKSGLRGEDYYNAIANYGTVLYNLGRYELSEKYLRQAEKTYTQSSFARGSRLHLNLGLLYLLWGKTDVSEQQLLLALEEAFSRKSGFSTNDLSIFFGLVQVYEQKNNYGKALYYAKEGQAYLEKRMLEAVNYLSESELQEVSGFFLGRNNGILEAAQYWNKPELNGVCYDNLLFTKGFVLENALKMRRAFEKKGQGSPQWLEWKALRRQIAGEISKYCPNGHLIDSLRQKANAWEKVLAKGTSSADLSHWQQVQSSLASGEAAIEFARYENNKKEAFYLAFVLTKNAAPPQVIPLCSERQLAALFGKDTFPLAQFYGTNADLRLYDLVFQPLMSYIKDIKKVWYSPIGLLHRVNFSAIAISSNNILADKMDLALLGSSRQVIEKKTVPALHLPPLKPLLLGGIDYGGNAQTKPATGGGVPRHWPVREWPYLQGSLEEVQEAARLLKAGGVPPTLQSDTSATERWVRQYCSMGDSPGILHFSTHAFYTPDTTVAAAPAMPLGAEGGSWWHRDPMQRVGIVMAGGNNAGNPERQSSDDGILSAYEVSLLDLQNTQLAIVSACDSGLGDLDPTEGVWGLQRAFRIAGTRYVLLSLWKANDKAAKDFMVAFYNHWMAHKKSVHEAFVAAQKEARNYNPDPKYWAGFILAE